MNSINAIEISPEEFRALCERVVEIAVDYLKGLDARAIPPAASGAEMERVYHTPAPETGLREEALEGLAGVARDSRAQNGRFFGYVMGSGELAAAAADLLCSAINQNVTAWRSAPAGVTLERTVVDWLAQAIGCAGFRGSLTGGGSAANLMALAMARETASPSNETGMRAGSLAVYASTEAHMSIAKAVALLGIGRDNLRLIAVDRAFRMIPEELDAAMRQDKETGRIPMAVVGTAGGVNTGAIDPLTAIAEIAARHGAWFHVDGAYGALAAISAAEKFEGMARADSISLDPHKWLYQPIDCGCLLYRDAAAARRAFSHSGDYARALSSDPLEGASFFEESIELSRRFRALKLWFSLRYHGLRAFRKAIANDLAHAQRLGERIVQQNRLELMAPIELSAVCFRYVGDGDLRAEQINAANFEILQRTNARGQVYLSNATLRGEFCLRACITNHRTTDADIDRVPAEVLAAAQEVLSGR